MRIVVSGLGEMGSSLVAALKKADPSTVITGVDPDEQTLEKALQIKLADDVSTDLMAVAPTADVIILSAPTSVIIQQLQQLNDVELKPDVLITDTGSTKVQVLEAAQALLAKGIKFAGGHAMAGTAKAGISAVDPLLYDQAPYFVIGPNETANQELKDLLDPLNAHLIDVDAQKHDEMMAYLSDLPHIAAAALVNSTGKITTAFSVLSKYAAGGFKDTTRIGAADPKMWTDILTTNREATLSALRNYQHELDELIEALETDDEVKINDFFTSSQKLRRQIED